MPSFAMISPSKITTATALDTFMVRLTVSEAPPAAPTATIEFAVNLVDATGHELHRLAGDLTPYLTPAQVSAFSNAAIALYAKAKAELIT